MPPTKLEESADALAQITRAKEELSIKISLLTENRDREMSAQHLLNFELSNIQNDIDQTKKEIEQLQEQESVLIKANERASVQLKRIRNYFHYVSPMQVDRKAEWMQNLKGLLESLDFTIEEHLEEPTRNVDSFTQPPRQF